MPSPSRKPSMKRRRPWASAAVVLLSASQCLAAALPNSDGLILREEKPIETNVTPTPTPVSMQAAPTPAPLLIRKESYPINLDLLLNVTDSIDLNELLQDVDLVLEDYLFSELSKLEKDSLNVRDVSLDVILRQRRHALRRNLKRNVNMAVNGAVRYDMDATGSLDDVNGEIQENLVVLLQADNIGQALDEAEVDGIINIQNATILPTREETKTSQEEETRETKLTGQEVEEKDSLERPSTLSIIFGFILTGIAVAGLVLYAYIFCRKRRKRLRRKKQMQQSFQYRLPNSKVSPNKQHHPSPPSSRPTASHTVDDNEASSEGSSYHGIESGSESGPGDSFARELEMAASLDQEVWENFQRRKQALGSTKAVKAIDAPAPDSGKRRKQKARSNVTKSFPYGDEMPDAGVEWTSNVGDGNNWEPYNGGTKSEEKKDEWSPQEPPAQSGKSAAAIQSIEKTLEEYGLSLDEEPQEPSDTPSFTESILEVARLSRFVKRYEKKRERRVQREMERSRVHPGLPENDTSNESHDPAGIRGSMLTRSPPDDPQTETTAYLQNLQESLTAREQKKRPPNSRHIDLAGRITTYTGNENNHEDNYRGLNVDTFSHEMTSVSDDETMDDDTKDGSLLSGQRRLGISPFNAQHQEPEDVSFNYGAMSPMMQNLVKAEAVREKKHDEYSQPIEEQTFGNSRRTQSEGSGHGTKPTLASLRGLPDNRNVLHDLRDTNAIIDSSQSDVNIGAFPTPHQDAMRTPPRARTPTDEKHSDGASPNPRFNRLRNLFEDRPNNAIFPPDQHWQYGAK